MVGLNSMHMTLGRKARFVCSSACCVCDCDCVVVVFVVVVVSVVVPSKS